MSDDTEYRQARAAAEGDLRSESDLLIRALNAAWVNLHWLTTDPDRPDRYALALAVLADPAAPERAEQGEDAGIRSKGGHGDPTGEAATGAVSSLLEKRTELTDLVALIADTASFIREATTRALYDVELARTPPTLTQAISDVSYCLTANHTVRNGFDSYRRLDRDEEARELSHATDLLYRQTSTLRTLVLGHLRSAIRPPTAKPKQPPRLSCKDCAAYGLVRDVAAGVSKTRCEDCHRFRKSHGVKPTEAICRRWDYDRNVPPGMVLEAKAASQSRRRSKAS